MLCCVGEIYAYVQICTVFTDGNIMHIIVLICIIMYEENSYHPLRSNVVCPQVSTSLDLVYLILASFFFNLNNCLFLKTKKEPNKCILKETIETH